MEAARTTAASGARLARRLGHRLNVDLGRRVRLGHDDDVGHAQHGLAWMMRRLVPRPQGIDQDDLQVGLHEREIVVAAIPDDDVGLHLRSAQDAGIVDAGEDDVACTDVRLVLLALLDRARSRVEIARGWRSAAPPGARDRRRAWDGASRRPSGLAAFRSRASQRAVCDLPTPVRTAQMAMTGRRDVSMVRVGPSSVKSAPAASAIEALCMTKACSTSL